MAGENKDGKGMEVLFSLKKIFENRWARLFLRYITNKNRFKHALEVYCKLKPASSLGELINAKILGFLLRRGAKIFDVKENDIIETFKNPEYVRGLNLVMKSIATYGITKPQKLTAPFIVVWDYTSMCNLKCKHCYANAGKLAKDELSTEERYKVIDKLDKAGVVLVAFSGGEPLMRKDFFEIAKYAREKGMFVSVASNGTLITRKVAERMKEIGVGYVEISLDHIDPKIHDEFRGVKGAWKRAVEGIKNCVKVGISTGMATTVTKYNYQSIPSMLEFAKKLGVDYFMAFNFVPTRRGKEISDYDLTPEERERLLELLYERLCEWEKPKIFSTCPAYARISLERVEKGKGKEIVLSHFGSAVLEGKTLAIADFIGGCGAGRNYCSIEYNGDVQPCVFIPVKVGNVIKEDFEKIWTESEIFEKLRNRELLKGACGECKYKYLCGGCRARAFAIAGDILDSDPGCIVVEEEVRR